MKAKLRNFVSFTLVLTSSAGALGAAVRGGTRVMAKDEVTEVALGSLTPAAVSCQTYLSNEDSSGNPLTLFRNGEEVSYDNGILTVPSSRSYASVYFTDVQENGYQTFVSDIGILSSSADSGEAEFRVIADGQQVYASGTVTGGMDAQNVEIDLSDVEVLQLVVDARGSNTGDLAAWAGARFLKDGDKPYLAVDDLEFNKNWQVTPQNILEYVSAKDSSGNDLTDRITYTTDYSGQESGTFGVTYTVSDDAGNTHSRTVSMKVTGEDYTGELSLDRLKKPWASYLYHGRGTLGTQGKKAWDLILGEILNFDASKWQLTTRWNEEVYVVDVDLQAAGIFTVEEQMKPLANMFMDDEPRTFILKDWGCDLTKKDGLVSHVKMWVKKSQADQYDAMLMKIEGNAQNMLKEHKADMTEAQGLYYVSNAYKSWLKYGGGGQLLSDSLGNGLAVCGGNARGYVYLSQRLGSKSVWGRSGSHAWSFTKLVNVKEWYKTDLLSGEFLAPGKNGEGNLSVGGDYRPRHYKWFVFGSKQYDKELLRYPSVWLSLSNEQIVIPSDTEYDLYSYVSDFGSIFSKDYAKEEIAIAADKTDENGNVIRENIAFPSSGNSSSLTAGWYRIRYTAEDEGRSALAEMKVRVTGESADRKGYGDRVSVSTNKSGVQDPLGLWTGSEEKWYDNGIYINDGGSITFSTEGENYRYVSFGFGIKDSVRQNVNWGYNGKVAAKVEITTAAGTETAYEGAVLGWKTPYEDIFLELPEDTVSVTIWSLDKGSGNGHAGIGGLTFYRDGGSIGTLPEENPPALSADRIEINDTDDFNIFTAFKGTDTEDGTFELNEKNFIVETIDKVDGRYPAGTFELNYQLIDSDGNVTTGVITLVVNKTEDSSGEDSEAPLPEIPDNENPDNNLPGNGEVTDPEEPDTDLPGNGEVTDPEEPDTNLPGNGEVTDPEEPDTNLPGNGEVTDPEEPDTDLPGNGEVTDPEEPDTDLPGNGEVTDPEEPDTDLPGNGEVTDPEAPDTNLPGNGEVTDPEEPDTDLPEGNDTDSEASVVVDTDKTISSVILENVKDVFPAGTVVKVESIVSGSIFKRTEAALKDLIQSMNKAAVFEFTASCNGAEVQPSDRLKAVFAVPDGMNRKTLKMFYIDEDGGREELDLSVNEDTGTATVYLEHFSTYVLVDVSDDSVNTAENPSQDSRPSTGVMDSYASYAGILLLAAGLIGVTILLKKRSEEN